MSARRPAGLHLPAGSARARPGVAARRIPVPRVEDYDRTVTVDLADDGIAQPVVFTAAGTAIAFTGPTGWGQDWQLDQCFVQTSIGTLDAAVASLFVGAGPIASPVATLQVAATLAGGGSQFGLGGTGLSFGEFVIAQWSGGTPGAVAYLRVSGLKTVLRS